ncbi:Pr6Pr family membrane protein [Microbacterium sp. ARD32]|uniref:Pr6Pr family membrane protein n=1 Tax=Microbacterium sp. ARD32 TaxID=2962577 RepID=UPI0028821544|nr:Pr6Pr family membrane protein [Microbacterium sp. ARD32]MDT0156095.1 Pr6Pr family membrane protein [Microbacterium sp. ARD32]
MLTRRIFGWLRLLAAAACVVSLTHRMLWGMGSQTLASENFFAYLTIQSNVAFTIITLIAGITALRRARDPIWLTSARALVLSWTVTAGLAFSIIVWQAGVRGIPITVPWSDVVLHYVLPACAVAGWVLGPGRRAASWRVLPLVLLYPVIWGVFTIWRGRIIGWYPYYFLDPRQVSGLPEMSISCLAALSIFAVVASALVLLSRVRVRVAPWGVISSRPKGWRRRRPVPLWRRPSHRAR